MNDKQNKPANGMPAGPQFKTPELGDCYTSDDGATFIIAGIGPNGEILALGSPEKEPKDQLRATVFDNLNMFNNFLLDDPAQPSKGFWMHFQYTNRYAGIVAARKALAIYGYGNVVLATGNASRPAQMLEIINHTLQGV